MRALLSWMVDEAVVVTVILLNSVSLFMVSASEQAQGGVPEGLWFALDYACVVFFLLEMAVKIGLASFRDYYADRWNRFDFFIVLASSPVLLTPVIDLSAFSIVLMLRLGRLFRMFRLLRFIPDREKMIAGIIRALKASVGVFLVVVVVNLIFALGASMLFHDLAPQYFGDPLESLYSMFQVFTVEGWHEIPRALSEAAAAHGQSYLGAVARVYFVVAVFIGGILGLSLANAVFVDQMVIDNNDDLEVRIDRLTDEIRNLRAELRTARDR